MFRNTCRNTVQSGNDGVLNGVPVKLSQSSAIAGAILVAFIIFVTVRGELPYYIGIFTGQGPPAGYSSFGNSASFTGGSSGVSVGIGSGGGSIGIGPITIGIPFPGIPFPGGGSGQGPSLCDVYPELCGGTFGNIT